jgi:uncharacterized HAD superfamily protein
VLSVIEDRKRSTSIGSNALSNVKWLFRKGKPVRTVKMMGVHQKILKVVRQKISTYVPNES